MKLLSLLLCASLGIAHASAAAAAQPTSDFRQIRADEAIQLRTDRAYLLLRIAKKGVSQAPIFLRVPTDAEIAAFDAAKAAAFDRSKRKVPYDSFVFDYQGAPNLFGVDHKKWLAADAATETVLIEARPGEYVLYGQGFAGFLYQCLCLGTVGFNAPPGIVTDLGTYMTDNASKPSVFPELAAETNLGRTASMDYMLFATALRPASQTDAVPPSLDARAVRRAEFHAVGPFVDPNVMLINRLAAIPGVLEYRDGRVFDVATGQEARAR